MIAAPYDTEQQMPYTHIENLSDSYASAVTPSPLARAGQHLSCALDKTRALSTWAPLQR